MRNCNNKSNKIMTISSKNSSLRLLKNILKFYNIYFELKYENIINYIEY